MAFDWTKICVVQNESSVSIAVNALPNFHLYLDDPITQMG